MESSRSKKKGQSADTRLFPSFYPADAHKGPWRWRLGARDVGIDCSCFSVPLASQACHPGLALLVGRVRVRVRVGAAVAVAVGG
jgi:hypothetical protein